MSSTSSDANRSDLSSLLALALSSERSLAERRRALAQLEPLLHHEEAVRALLEAARTERSIEMRAALLDTLLAIDVTRLADRAPYLDGLAYFASLEPESALRTLAIERLGRLAPTWSDAESRIAESLACDLDATVQQACLTALASIPRKSDGTVAVLLEYGRRAPRALRPALAALYASLENEPAQAGLALLLQTDEETDVQARALNALEPLPVLAPATALALASYLTMQPREDLHARAVRILTAKQHADPGLLDALVRALEETPDRAELARSLQHRLASHPELVPRLARLAVESPSSRLALALIELLADAQLPQLFVALVRHRSARVRADAIAWCAAHAREHGPTITAALAAAIPDEPLRALRHALVRALVDAGRLPPEVEAALLAWFEREPDPRIQETLAAVIAGIAITDANRAALLHAFRLVLEEPFFDDRVKEIVTRRLRAFAYRDEPELVRCLGALLARATEIEQVDELHAQLRRLDPDPDAMATTLLELFHRFVHHYPREPLAGWLHDFQRAAATSEAVRAQLPYLVRVTGATWLLEGAAAPARKETLLPAFLAAVRQGTFRAPENLLREAYQSRTLRKSDLLAILDLLLVWPGQGGLVQIAFEILRDAGLVTPELVDRCLASLAEQPGSEAASEVQKFLAQAGAKDPAMRERILERFTQAEYTRFCRRDPGASDLAAPPRTWHDWQWQGWRLMHDGWPIGALALELAPAERLRSVVATAPDDVPAVTTLAYVVLQHWWRGGKIGPDELRALAALRGHTAGRAPMAPLHDRALCLFAARWNELAEAMLRAGGIPHDLALAAADVQADLCALHPRLKKPDDPPYPQALRGLDVDRLRARAPLAPPGIDALALECRVASADDEAEAKRVWQEYGQAIGEGKKEDALARLDALLGRLRATSIVRPRVQALAAARAEIESRPRLATAAEEAAARALIRSAQDAGDPDRARTLLDELFLKYAHTECVAHEQGFLGAWRKKLEQRKST